MLRRIVCAQSSLSCACVQSILISSDASWGKVNESLRSFLTHDNQVVGGLPGFLGAGLQNSFSASRAGVFSSRRNKCPVKFRRRLVMVLLQGSLLVILYNSSLVYTRLGHILLIARLSSLRWKESMLLLIVFVVVHSSVLYINTLSTYVLNCLILVWMLTNFDVKMPCNFFMASNAFPFLALRSSAVSNLLPNNLHFFHFSVFSWGGLSGRTQSKFDHRHFSDFKYFS